MAEDARRCDGGSGGQGRRRQWLEQAILFSAEIESVGGSKPPRKITRLYTRLRFTETSQTTESGARRAEDIPTLQDSLGKTMFSHRQHGATDLLRSQHVVRKGPPQYR